MTERDEGTPDAMTPGQAIAGLVIVFVVWVVAAIVRSFLDR